MGNVRIYAKEKNKSVLTLRSGTGKIDFLLLHCLKKDGLEVIQNYDDFYLYQDYNFYLFNAVVIEKDKIVFKYYGITVKEL